MSVTTEIDQSLARITVEASIQAYYAFSKSANKSCCLVDTCVTPPMGYDTVDCWTGVNTLGYHNYIECFGVVFRSQSPPYTYIFAFRGTDSPLDLVDDLDIYQQPFRPCFGWPDDIPCPAPPPLVAQGFWGIYQTPILGPGTSMQNQLFNLLEKYRASAQPIDQLVITGHSLGAALSELFTLDLALSRYHGIPYTSYNYASPRLGDPVFARLYDKLDLVKDPKKGAKTRTLRIQNTYDIVPCFPAETQCLPLYSWPHWVEVKYQHVGRAYLLAFYGKYDWDWTPMGKYHDHQALNYQAVLDCAFNFKDQICINDDLKVKTDAKALVSEKPDPSTLCSIIWPMVAVTPRISTGAVIVAPNRVTVMPLPVQPAPSSRPPA